MSYDTKKIFGIKKVNELFRNNEIVHKDDLSCKYEKIVENNDLILIYRPSFFKNEKILPTKLESIFSQLNSSHKYKGLFTNGCSFDLSDDLIANYSPGWHLISCGIVEDTETLIYVEQTELLYNMLIKIRGDLGLKISLENNKVFTNKIEEIRKLGIGRDPIGPKLVELNANNYRHSFMDYVIDSIIINLLSENIYNPKHFVWTKEYFVSDKRNIDDMVMVGFFDDYYDYHMLGYARSDVSFNSEKDLATTFSIPIS